MNFNHDTGLIDSVLTIDTSIAPPLGGATNSLSIVGSGSLVLPLGADGARPANAAGQIRYNTTSNLVEFNNGSAWNTLSVGGSGVTSVAATGSTGLSVGGSPITSSGTLTFTLDAGLSSLASLATTGMVVQSVADTFITRSVAGTASNITVTNGDGVSGNPTINLATVTQGSSGTSFLKFQLDSFGRVINNTAVVAGDITPLVDATYVNVSGDSMNSAANLTFSGGGEVLGLPATPTTAGSAASKAYVDSLVQGLDPKGSVRVATTAAGTLATSFANGSTIDGITLATNDRILIKNQATQAENGIYTVNASGAPTRSIDMDAWTEVPGTFVFVEVGTANADTGWVCTSDQGGTLGSTAITFVQFAGVGSYTAGTGLTLTGTQFSLTSPVVVGNGGTGTTSTPTNGQLLIGNGTNYTLATITQGTGITVTNGAGSITIANAGVTNLAGTANQITSSAATGSITLSLPSTLVAPGSVAVTTALFQSLSAAVSAAGTTQGTATALTASTNVVTTVAASSGVVLPTAASPFGWQISVVNRGANPLAVYPATGAQIDSAGANNAITVPVGEELKLVSTSATQWIVLETVKLVGTGLSIAYGNGTTTFTNTGVTSLSGTANQITASASTGAITLSLPSAVTLPGSLVVTTSATVSGLTANSFLFSGTAGLLTTTSAPTNGQLLIGSTGAAPVAAAITQGTGITVTNGAGSITIANAGVTSFSAGTTGFTPSTGTTGAVTLAGTLNIANGGTGAATTSQNFAFIGPTSGSGAPSFRALTLGDLTNTALRLYTESPSTPTAPVASGANSVALGSGSSATVTDGFAVSTGASASLHGAKAFANGQFGTIGDAQRLILVARNSTTNATQTELFLDGSAARLVVPNNSLWTFSILVAGRRTDATGGGAGYKFDGVIRKDTTAGSTTLVGAVVKSILGETNAAWDVTVDADTTNGSLRIRVTGEAAKTIRWVASMEVTQVTN